MSEGLGHLPAAQEVSRLAALALYKVLDTPPEFAHDALTELGKADGKVISIQPRRTSSAEAGTLRGLCGFARALVMSRCKRLAFSRRLHSCEECHHRSGPVLIRPHAAVRI